MASQALRDDDLIFVNMINDRQRLEQEQSRNRDVRTISSSQRRNNVNTQTTRRPNQKQVEYANAAVQRARQNSKKPRNVRRDVRKFVANAKKVMLTIGVVSTICSTYCAGHFVVDSVNDLKANIEIASYMDNFGSGFAADKAYIHLADGGYAYGHRAMAWEITESTDPMKSLYNTVCIIRRNDDITEERETENIDMIISELGSIASSDLENEKLDIFRNSGTWDSFLENNNFAVYGDVVNAEETFFKAMAEEAKVEMAEKELGENYVK